jgi:lipopolysaccharide transport system permease protein
METSHRQQMSGWIQHRSLIWQLAKREIAQRYKNSVFGGFWVVAQPLIQLLLYAFVFQVVLRSRWGVTVPNTGKEVPFGLILFVGILLHALLAEILTRGPALIISNVSFVKRVIFPLEILPVVTMVTALVTVIFGFLILFVAFMFVHGSPTLVAFLIVIPIFFFFFCLS